MRDLKNNIYVKIGVIVLLTLLLLIPKVMIENLIHEREYRQTLAINEVSAKWGKVQTLAGPIVSIPYYRYVRQKSNKNDSRDTTTNIVRVKEHLHFLPNDLKINGQVFPEKRYRALYEIVVYNSQVNISGVFKDINFKDFDIPMQNILFDKAFISIGISDLRGIEKQIDLNWNNDKLSFNPGTVTKDVVRSGINARIPLKVSNNSLYKFSFKLDLKGSQKLYFTPVGKITNVTLNSKWKDPSFNGSFLPDSRDVSEKGFTANWNVLHLNRNYPQSWRGGSYNIYPSSFGVDLLLPVDNYQKSIRSIKYAILFLILTFMVFFFVEILKDRFIHPIQYILVGLALIVFYSLLLAFSEHINYNLAFITSAILTIFLISAYVKAILKSNKLTVLISGILFILYTFIFVIIQLQDYALLIGSIGIFIILGLVMYFSRKIDWYNLNSKKIEK
jgi:inner membrane protein